MKTLNKTTTLGLGICLSMMILHSGCVSLQRFNDSESSRVNCEEKNRSLSGELKKLDALYRTTDAQKKKLEESTTESMKKKQDELNAKEQALADREAKLKELRTMANNQKQVLNSLKSKLADALVGYPKDELSVEIKDGKVYVSLAEKLLFPSGSTLIDPKGKKALVMLAEVLNKNPEIQIMIEGHTDNVPINTVKFSDNWDLSVQRATAVVRELRTNGVEPTRLIPSGKGEYFPVDVNTTVEGKAHNRRTEIILSPKLDELYQLLQTDEKTASK